MFILVSLTAVSAVDANQTDDVAAEDSDTVTQDILTEESVGAGDFKELNDNVTSATTILELTKNYTYNPNVDLDYRDGINITKDITVDGKGYTIDGNGQSRIFNIANATVTLKNINFINGNASLGAAICFENGNLTIIGCNFSNNVGNGTSSMGGAIFFEGNDLLIADSKFMSNEAYEYGAVFADSLTAEVRNTEFSNNAAEDYGALAVLGGDVLIYKCSFADNSAGYYGGAILFREINATVSDCTFTKNSAKSGGAIQWIGGKGRVFNSKFIGNTAKSFTATGGAIDIVNTEAFKVLNSTFIDNYATYRGAAICADNCSGSEISDCIFNDNRAGNGGAIHWYSSNEIHISYCNFTNNAAKDDGEGGAVEYSFCSNDTISNCIFINNTARDGGAIGSQECHISECIFMNNSGQRGGALCFLMEYPADISNCKFINNSANEGGAVFVSRWSNLITIENASFINNTADSGGAICANNIVVVTNSNFTANNATQGGAIYCKDSNLTVGACNFLNNSANGDDSSGGAILFEGDDLVIADSKFISNEAYNCGAVSAESVRAEIRNTEFSENGAYDYGALGVFSGDALIDNCEFNGNYANMSAAALSLHANVTVNNTRFNENRANRTGVLFYESYNSDEELIIDQCQFIDNDCCAVYLSHYNAKILNSRFKNSLSEDGIAIYNGAINKLYLSNNDVNTLKPQIFTAYGGDITSGVTVEILNNDTRYYHLNETVTVFFYFYDDNENMIQVQDFDLLINNTKTDYEINKKSIYHDYEANFTSNEVGSYPVTIADTYLSNLTVKTAEINIVNVTDDFSTLRKLIDNANATLTLDKNYTYNPLTDLYIFGVGVSKNITIDGAGFTLDGKQMRMFIIVSDNVIIKNITFVNGASYAGGAVNWFGNNGLLADCTFINNVADNGGAVEWAGHNGTVSNCIFMNNLVDGSGGAIEFDNARDCEILDCLFINNRAKDGGAIYGADSIHLNVSGSKFINNSADYYGGAVVCENCYNVNIFDCSFTNHSAGRGSGALDLTGCDDSQVSYCNFTNNSAKSDGGAIFVDSDNVKIDNCNFADNNAYFGGAIYWDRYNGKVSDCNFADNGAIYGGAVYCGECDVVISNSNFTANNATQGGAIYCKDSNLTVGACNFTNNVAEGEYSCGGAIDFNGTNLFIIDSKFISNEAHDCGAVSVESVTTEIINTEFIGNGAYDCGAVGIFEGNALIENCTFDSNYANRSIAALSISTNATVNNTVFKSNSAEDCGALFYESYSENDTLIADYCQFIDNDCSGAYLKHYNAVISNSKFKNSVSDKGIAIYNGATNRLYLSNNTVNKYNAQIYSAYGGNIISSVTCVILNNRTVYKHLNETVDVYLYFQDDNRNRIKVMDFDLLVNNTKIDYVLSNKYQYQYFEGNFTSDKIGSYPVTIGDTYLSNLTLKTAEINIVNVTDDFSTLQNLIDNANGTLTIDKNYTYNPLTDADLYTGIWIVENIIIDGAGFTIDGCNQARIFYIESGKVTIKNITFINGNVSYGGGAIIWDASNGQLADCTFINNHADSGGAVEWSGKKGIISNCMFMNNSAEDVGGAIYLDYNGNCEILDSSFIDNHAGNGGAIYDDACDSIHVSGSNFVNNSADDYGGAIMCEDCESIDISDCTFTNNSAGLGSGAIDLTGCDDSQVSNCNFTNNSADGEGGAIYWEGYNGKVSDCNFVDNCATDGGAIYHGDGNLVISNSNFTANNAEKSGAAAYSKGNMTVIGCQFNSNHAGEVGGAIFVNEDLTVINSNFTQNGAEYGAGAIFANHAVEIDECNFENNTAGSVAGAVLVLDNLNISNSAFAGNAAERGGAIAAANTAISNSNFTANNAGEGGSVYAVDNVTVNNCLFEGNTAEDEGGAIKYEVEHEKSTLSINGSTFAKNTAGSGGALAVGGDAKISNSKFENNTAEDGSDNIATFDGANVTLENVSPENLTVLSHVDVIAWAMIGKYGNDAEIRANVIKDGVNLTEGSISVVINNKTYSADVVNGFAAIKIPNLDAGDYDGVKVTFNGNGKYTNSFDTVNLHVLKLNTTVTAAAKTYVINYGGKYSVTIKDENGKVLAGKTVTLTINGKEYKATSDANGVATFSLTKSMLKSSGVKTVIVKFAGDNNYVGSNATAKITVNKETVKILKAKKTYKFKKSKKTKNIKVTLKNSKNNAMKKVKVTLKLSGKKIKGKKTITAKTNKKGVVTFKLGKKLTKKTKVKYTITYKGNAYYKKVTKKGKITVK